MKNECQYFEFNGKKYFPILPCLEGESGLVLDGKPLPVGTVIETLWLDSHEPYVEIDKVCLGPIGTAGRFGYYLENTHKIFEYASIFSHDLWARWPEFDKE